MTWKSYIYPQTIARFTSPYNKDIRVVEESGRYKILVNGSPQSGPYIEKLWKSAFQSFGIPKQLDSQSILVLGIAGGTVIHLLRKWYPSAKITAVDIDQTMIDIGEKYFSLKNIHNLSLVNADAQDFIHKQKKYDLIIIDLSFGRHLPSFITTMKFLTGIQKRKNGFVVINFLREKEYKEISESLKRMLIDLFSSVQEKQIFLNRFFMVK